jgi:hypothetical protein
MKDSPKSYTKDELNDLSEEYFIQMKDIAMQLVDELSGNQSQEDKIDIIRRTQFGELLFSACYKNSQQSIDGFWQDVSTKIYKFKA